VDLPFVDEHHVRIAAPVDVVWSALTAYLKGTGASGTLARLLGADPRQASGEPPNEGATVPGFRVARVEAGRVVGLAGRHRFSRYALVFSLSAGTGTGTSTTLLSARTYAEFPHVRGRIYRALVIGSGAHRVITRRMLRAVRRLAEGR
jgi:hypothetical protein